MKVSNIEVTLLGSYGDDLNVVNAARVSFNNESEFLEGNDLFQTPYGWQRWTGNEFVAVEDSEVTRVLHERDKKLIKYLADHKHHSPFNHSFLSFRIKAPLFVARQLQKHRFMPWNEVSRRYVDSPPEFYFPPYWRKKADNVKQGSSDEEVEFEAEEWSMCCEWALKQYRHMLSEGVCPEQARMVLPQNMMTEWVWSGTLGAFLDMLVLRLDGHTQRETQEVARLIAVKVKELFPVSYNAYLGENNG